MYNRVNVIVAVFVVLRARGAEEAAATARATLERNESSLEVKDAEVARLAHALSRCEAQLARNTGGGANYGTGGGAGYDAGNYATGGGPGYGTGGGVGYNTGGGLGYNTGGGAGLRGQLQVDAPVDGLGSPGGFRQAGGSGRMCSPSEFRTGGALTGEGSPPGPPSRRMPGIPGSHAYLGEGGGGGRLGRGGGGYRGGGGADRGGGRGGGSGGYGSGGGADGDGDGDDESLPSPPSVPASVAVSPAVGGRWAGWGNTAGAIYTHVCM